MKVEGKPVPAAVLDTGSKDACSVSRVCAEQLGLLDGQRQSTLLTAVIEGITTDAVITLRKVQIGSFTVRHVPATVIGKSILDTPINIGWPLVRAFDIHVDLCSGVLGLRADDRVLAEPFPRDRSGLGAVRLPRIGGNWPRPGDRQGCKDAGTALNLELAGGKHVRRVLEDH